MNNDISVTIVMPVFNRADTVGEAIMSVLRQSIEEIELIVIDDCSKDGSLDVISSINDHRLKVIKLQKNVGACTARNVGIAEARGIYIAFNDSDDIWHPGKLKLQLDKLISSDLDVVFSRYSQYLEGTKRTLPKKNKEGNCVVGYNELLVHSLASTQTIIGRSRVIKQYQFDTNLGRFQDWDFILGLAKGNSRIYFLDSTTVDAYVQNNSISRNNQKGRKALSRIFVKNAKGFLFSPKALVMLMWKYLRLFR
jgi:glycosyltransferase involved in cell wall biosynthesis